MNKEITRRAVLGTVIVGLTAIPFAVRILRKPAKFSNQHVNETMLARIAEKSGLAVSDVRTALDIYQSERIRWLQFRGFKANVNVTLEGTSHATNNEVKIVSESGILSLKLTEEHGTGYSPWGGHLRFDSTEGRESSECTKFSDPSKVPVVSGRRTELIDPPYLMELLSTQFALAACFDLASVGMLLEEGKWELKPQVPDGIIANGFRLLSVDRSNKNTAWLHEVFFEKGVFSCIKGDVRDGCDYCTTCEDVVNIANFPFPTIYNSEMNFVSERARLKYTLRLSDVELTIV